jgi:hypothetical protein
MLLSLMLSISRQKSSMDMLSTEACEVERLNAGEWRDSLDSILLILRQRGIDFLEGRIISMNENQCLCVKDPKHRKSQN